jgi:MFS family permease
VETNSRNLTTRAVLCGCLLAVLQQGKQFIQPAISLISEAFPNLSITTIQQLISGVALPTLIGALLAGPLSQYISRKKLALISSLIITIGGFGPVLFIHNFYAILALRLFMGLGLGLASPCAVSIIATYVKPEKANKYIGIKEGVAAVGSFLVTIIAGWLAAVTWTAVFYMYLIGVVVILAVLFLLPEDKPVAKIKKSGVATEKFKPNALLITSLSFAFLYMVFFNAIGLNLALYMKSTGLGGAVQSGYVSSAVSFGSIVAGFILAWLVKVFKKGTLGIGAICLAVGFGLFSIAPSIEVCLIAAFLVGLGNNICVAQGTYLCTKSTNPNFYVLTTGLFVAAIHLAQFITPYVVNPIADAFKGGLNVYRWKYGFVGAMELVVGVIAIIAVNFAMKKFEAQERKA